MLSLQHSSRHSRHILAPILRPPASPGKRISISMTTSLPTPLPVAAQITRKKPPSRVHFSLDHRSSLDRNGSFCPTIVGVMPSMGLSLNYVILTRTAWLLIWIVVSCPRTMLFRPAGGETTWQECVPHQNRQRSSVWPTPATTTLPVSSDRNSRTGLACMSTPPQTLFRVADQLSRRLQRVTNWFQNQRSQAKKHREESSIPDVPTRQPAGSGDGPTSHMPHPLLPPRSHHPSLVIPEHNSRPALPNLLSSGVDDYRDVSNSRSRMSLPPSLNSRISSPRLRRSALPYARDSRDLHIDEGRHYDNSSESARAYDGLSRPRRSRPEPHQLDGLKKLLHRTLTPSIEERSALALEIGM